MPTDEKPKPKPKPTPTVDPRLGGPPSGGVTNRDAPRDTTPYVSADQIAQQAWFTQNSPWVMPILQANPGYVGQIKDLMWQYGRVGTDESINVLIDKLNQGGFMDALVVGTGDTSGGGGRGGGGGGGGGLSAEQQLDQAIAEIRNKARTFGFQLDDDAISSLAQAVVAGKWTSAQLDDYLTSDPAAQVGPGTITATIDQIKNLASQQLITISDATAREYATRIASSEQTLEGVRSAFQAQAVTQYGWAADLINQGISVRDIMLPARDMIANTLEIAPDSIDLSDPKYLNMAQTQDEKTGFIRAATLGEVAERARKDDRYRATVAAKDQAAGIGVTLAKMFTGG